MLIFFLFRAALACTWFHRRFLIYPV